MEWSEWDVSLAHKRRDADLEEGAGRVRGQIDGHRGTKVESGIRTAVFGGLKPGRYAVMLFQDEDSTGRLKNNIGGAHRTLWLPRP